MESKKRVIVCDVCDRKLIGLAKIKEHMRVSYECRKHSVNADMIRLANPSRMVTITGHSTICEMVRNQCKEEIKEIKEKVVKLTVEQIDEYTRRV